MKQSRGFLRTGKILAVLCGVSVLTGVGGPLVSTRLADGPLRDLLLAVYWPAAVVAAVTAAGLVIWAWMDRQTG